MIVVSSDTKLDFDDVLIVPQRSTLTSRQEIITERTFKFYHSPRVWTGVPIICANMSFASFNLAKALYHHKMITCLHKYHSTESIAKFYSENNKDIYDYVWVSIGYKKSDLNHLLELKNKTGIQPNLCIDVPNGHMDVFVKYCKKVRENFPDSIIMAGNVTNSSSTQELLIYGGVDVVKCGVGGGSACLTRFVTGCGYPQLSCCIENSYVAHGLQSSPKKLGLICSDGGHKNSGDICKALCAGADFVMLGGYFAGVDECDGEWEFGGDYSKTVELNEKTKGKFTYYGMSSHHAQDTFEDGKKNYRASEGTKIVVPYKGTASNIIQELLGGVRSACCYIGADNIKNMSRCAGFCRVSKVHNNQNPVFGV
jgi:GMP reductase